MHFHHYTEYEMFQNVPGWLLRPPASAVSARLLPTYLLNFLTTLRPLPIPMPKHCLHILLLLLHSEFLPSYYHNHKKHTPNESEASGRHLRNERSTYHLKNSQYWPELYYLQSYSKHHLLSPQNSYQYKFSTPRMSRFDSSNSLSFWIAYSLLQNADCKWRFHFQKNSHHTSILLLSYPSDTAHTAFWLPLL